MKYIILLLLSIAYAEDAPLVIPPEATDAQHAMDEKQDIAPHVTQNATESGIYINMFLNETPSFSLKTTNGIIPFFDKNTNLTIINTSTTFITQLDDDAVVLNFNFKIVGIKS